MPLRAGKTVTCLAHAQNLFEQANNSGGGMKGRRKLKTTKWALEAQLIRESRAILASEEHASHRGRFLSRAEAVSAHAEPMGILAGVSRVRDNAVKTAE